MNRPLDSKNLSRGARVIKIAGDRQNTTGTVKGVDRGANTIGVQFDGDNHVTFECKPSEFKIATDRLTLTGKPPAGTVAR